MSYTLKDNLTKAREIYYDCPKKSLELCDKHLEENQKSLDCSAIQFRSYWRLQNWSEALVAADEMISHDPNFSLAYIERARAHYKCGNYSSALQDCKTALSKDDDEFLGSIPYRLSSLSYAAQGDVSNALDMANGIPELDVGEWFPPMEPVPAGTKAQFTAMVERMAHQVRDQQNS